MFKAYKYRIYPTLEQQQLIDQTIGCCRLVYNLALNVKIEAYKNYGVKLSAFDLCKQLIELKDEYTWLKDVDSQALQASVKSVDTAFKNFYNGFGYPKYKSKSRTRKSFRCPNAPKRIDWDNSLLTLSKLPNIPIRISRVFDGVIKTVTVSKTPTGKYFASILVDELTKEKEVEPIVESKTIGVDTGIKSFVVSSNGKVFEANRKFKENLIRLKVLSRRASRKKKGSNNQKKAYKRVALLHEKIYNQREDYIHKTTHQLTNDSQISSIVVEDLNVFGLIQNHKIAQAMSDISLGKFYELLGYKCRWRGINLIKIGRFDLSSKRCFDCGTINDTLTLADRQWTCICGETHDRDLNAAKNIKWFGLNKTKLNNKTAMGSRSEPVELLTLVGAMKQEEPFVIKGEVPTN